MSTVTNARPLLVTKAAAPRATAPTAPKPGAVNTHHPLLQVAPNTVIGAVTTGVNVGRMAFTPPVIFDVVKNAFKSGIGLVNLAWFIIPSAIRNVRDVVSDKISWSRGGANVITEAGLGVTKGIAAGVVVQSLSIATGPLLGLLPLSPALLPFVGIGLSMAGMFGTYWVFNKLVKKTGIDQKIADGLTKLLGGDKV